MFCTENTKASRVETEEEYAKMLTEVFRSVCIGEHSACPIYVDYVVEKDEHEQAKKEIARLERELETENNRLRKAMKYFSVSPGCALIECWGIDCGSDECIEMIIKAASERKW